MKTGPWLITGTLLGAFLGTFTIPIIQHGWEIEAYYDFRIIWGALIGLGAGLAIDLLLSRRRR